MICALQTTRSGSKSVPNKTLLEVDGKPLYRYNYDAAIHLTVIDHTFITSDVKQIEKEIPPENNIIRPAELCTDHASHYDVIVHGLDEIENRLETKVNILVILLGNNCGATPQLLNESIQQLLNNESLDSCISVGKYNMFNPFRAYIADKLDKSKLQPVYHSRAGISFQKRGFGSNEKNAFGDIFFFNGTFWTCRTDAIRKNKGAPPFSWLGRNISYIEQSPHVMELDASWQVPIVKATNHYEEF